jgi:DNA polymerase-3 subunit beta
MKATLDKPKEKASAPSKSVITLGHLKNALKVVGAAIQSRTTIPILQCVRIEQLTTGLAIEATNLDLYIRALVPESGGPKSPLLIPADKFSGWTKLLEGDDVKISATDSRSTMQCGRARAVLPLMAPESWPDNSIYGLEGESIALKQNDLARALRFAMIAVSNDASRFTLNGILLEGDGETLKLIATDGHCMMVYSLPCTEKIDLLLPSMLVRALLPLLDDEEAGISIDRSDKQILASVTGETPFFVAAPKMAGLFPQWKSVFPKDDRVEITVNARDLLSSLERCALLSDERSGLVVLNFSEKMVLSSASSQNGESEETLDYKGNFKGKLRIGISAEYLIDLAKKLDGDIRICLPSENSQPILFKADPHDGESLSYIIMPMRI